MNKFFGLILLSLLLILSIVFLVNASGTFQCEFISGAVCHGNSVRLIGVENDTGGFQNAHAQNISFDNYAYSICCNTTNASITISEGCEGDVTVLELSNETNAHVEIGTNSNYSVSACLESDWKHVYCTYSASGCTGGSGCALTMANSEGANASNAHVGNCSFYNMTVCCKLDNKAPVLPTLYYPADDNGSVNERRPNFNWSTSTDPESDTVDYTINLTCGTCDASCAEPNVDSISTTNYTVQSALCIDVAYNWTISACDEYDSCNTTISFNFTIPSSINVVFIHNFTDFGTIYPSKSNDTTDDSPGPMVVRNIGNVLANVTINATTLFTSEAMNTRFFQFMADENETGSYDTTCSEDDAFVNMDTNDKRIFCKLDYNNSRDEGELELNITAPSKEPSEKKTSTITIYPSTAE